MTTLRDYPHLPLLSIEQCLTAITLAGVPITKISDLAGVSRMAVYNWRTGRAKPYSAALNAVNTLAYKALHAVQSGELPQPNGNMASLQAALRISTLAALDPAPLLALLSKQI